MFSAAGLAAQLEFMGLHVVVSQHDIPDVVLRQQLDRQNCRQEVVEPRPWRRVGRIHDLGRAVGQGDGEPHRSVASIRPRPFLVRVPVTLAVRGRPPHGPQLVE